MPYETLVAIAESAKSIKGYGPVKEAAVAARRTRTAELPEPRPTVLAEINGACLNQSPA